MMAAPAYQITSLLEKMTSNDKDFRFMATNDLMTELQKEKINLDDDSERKIVKMLLKLLEDNNGEVQNLAVRCLGPLVCKVKDNQVEIIVDHLCNNMINEDKDKEQLRDISSIGLKTVINELPLTTTSLAASVCKAMTGRLSAAIAQQKDVSVQLEALDILADLLSRFGGLLVQFHSSLLESLQPQLKSQRLAVRKRAIICMGHLVMSCDQVLYMKLVNMLFDELTKSTSTSSTRTYIQAVGAVCRQAGHRFGDDVERVMPILISSINQDDDELKENVLQAFEAMTIKCGAEMSSHIPDITALCLQYIAYDPNYNYDDADDEEMDCDSEMEDDGTDDEYSDDDDVSWKVRRAAAKCLEAIILTHPELLDSFYKQISPQLIARFKEREENVKADLFHAYVALLNQTKPIVTMISHDGNMMDVEEGPISALHSQVPIIVKAVHKQMKEKSVRTRQGCFMLLTKLISVLPGCLSDHIPAIIPGIQYGLSDKQSSSNVKIDTLSFIQALLSSHHPTAFHPHAQILVPAIINTVADSFYKISSEALTVLQILVKILRPLDSHPTKFDFTKYTIPIYECCFVRLRAQDIDQEVKERAISCMGQIIAHLGDSLQAELPNCLPMFLDRLKNEILRLTAVKAITSIASSPLKIDLRVILPETLPVLASFLRKNQRQLKLSTLTLLDTLIKNYSNVISDQMLGAVLTELPPLIIDSDLHIAQLTLTLTTSVVTSHQSCIQFISKSSLPQVLKLAESPLLQGGALAAMLDLLRSLVASQQIPYTDLLNRLVQQVMGSEGKKVHKQGRANIAKCVASLVSSDASQALTVVNQFLAGLSSCQDFALTFSLLAIGEIGRTNDLSKIQNLKVSILNAFSHQTEEVKSAASYALGNIALGNLQEYLPFILHEIESARNRQYLLLHSLKEIISGQSSSPTGVQVLNEYIPSIWDQLYKHTECEEEGTRNVVAECLGKLCLIKPDELVPKLRASLGSPSPLVRTTIVTAMKFTITDQPQPIDNLLKNSIGEFLNSLLDPDLNVRRVALVAFNSAAHNKPSLIRDLLKNLLPHLYRETEKRKELIREVEMGPFKHEVDDGLDLRKAAFECMYTLLETCVDRLDIFEFLSRVQDGLKDHYDIKMLTYLMVSRVSQLCPGAVLQRLDKLVEPLKLTCTTKVKANSVKQEYEKQDELKRSAMRAIASLLAVPGADKHPQLGDLINQIRSTPDLSVLFESIQRDSVDSNSMETS